jgi:hypothetical protein
MSDKPGIGYASFIICWQRKYIKQHIQEALGIAKDLNYKTSSKRSKANLA